MPMLTNAQRKLISSLADVKGRRRAGLFAAEGTKCVLDTLGAFELRYLLATPQWLAAHPGDYGDAAVEVSREALCSLSALTLAPDVIAVYSLPEPPVFDAAALAGRLVLALDRVQDPGNLGTLMRTADWLGIDTVLASTDTVDCYNPKTIQATMGAISRVRVIYGDLAAMLAAMPREQVCGTFLDGDDIFAARLPRAGVLVLGNEGRGISPAVEATVGRRLFIPPYPAGRATSESLNVASAGAIALAQFRYGKD
ncbi:MAG: RNA methyltransferase [Bacteroides sp.]|nr:RNA methyltransferase [Bacteroides sp.]